MKAYLAARYSRHPEMQEHAKDLDDFGIVVTSRWIQGGHELRDGAGSDAWRQSLAMEDLADLLSADVVISFTEGPGEVPGRSRGGRHVEFGAALMLSKRCIVVGYRENVFHHLSGVEFYATWDEALVSLLRTWTPEPAAVSS